MPQADHNSSNRSDGQAATNKMASKSRCPICKKPTQQAFRPFCSKRCADVDLSRWLTGQYAIPVVEEDGGNSDDGNEET